MEIILVRHGESVFNQINTGTSLGRLYTGQYNTPLTAKGMKQALELQENPLFEKLDTIYASDLDRAVETAKLVTKNGAIIQDKRIRERSLGIFEGKFKHDLIKEYENFFKANKLFTRSFTEKAPQGENYTDMAIRAKEFLNELDLKKKKIAIFSHFSCIRVLVMLLCGLTEAETLTLKVENGHPIVLKGEHIGNFEWEK